MSQQKPATQRVQTGAHVPVIPLRHPSTRSPNVRVSARESHRS